MKQQLIGLGAVGLAATLLACAPSTDEGDDADGGGDTTLEVWSWRVEDTDAYEKIFDVYEEQHPGVTVEFKPYTATEYNTILSTGLSAEGGPDLAQLRAYGGLQPLCEADRLVRLDEEDVDLSAIPDDVLEGATCVGDGGVYGVPMASQALVMFYNKAVFDEHGLEEPTTWQELMDLGDTLVDEGVTPYATTAKDNWVLPILHDLFGAPRYGGPEFEQAVLDGSKDFTDPDYVASIDLLNDLVPHFPDDVVGVDYATAQTLFTSEQAAMYPGGSYELAFFQAQNADLEMGVFAVPPPPDSLVDHALTPGWVDASYGVNAMSPDKEEAVELARWMATPEFGQMIVDELDQINPVEGVTPSDPLLQEIVELHDAAPTPYLHLIDFRYGEPTGSDLMAAGLQEMLLGDTDAEGVASDVQQGVSQWFKPQS